MNRRISRFGRAVAVAAVVGAVGMALLLSGCDNRDDDDPHIDEFVPGIDKGEVEYDVGLGAEWFDEEDPDMAMIGTPVTNLAGRDDIIAGMGYDVATSPYYVQTHVKNPVLDVTKLASNNLFSEYRTNINNHAVYVGEDIHEYANSLGIGVNAGYKGVFTANFSMDFSLSNNMEQNTSFGKSVTHIRKRGQAVGSNIRSVTNTQLRTDYLSEGFRSEMNTLTPAALFDKYGTHVILHAMFGGRAEVSFTTTNTNRQTATDIKASVDAAYAGVSGGASTDISNTTRNFIDRSTLKIQTLGGSSGIVTNSFTTAQQQIPGWMNSVNESNMTFIEVTSIKDPTHMLPIWELFPTDATTRRDALMAEFNNRLAANVAALGNYQNMTVMKRYVKNIYVGFSNNTSTQAAAKSSVMAQANGEAVTFLPYSFNAGIRCDAMIIIGYTRTDNVNEAIRNINVNWRATPSAQTNYVLIRSNLNQGTPGGALWPQYSKHTSTGGPITDLYQHVHGWNSAPTGTGWHAVGWFWDFGGQVDFNEGVGGSPIIHLWMRR